MATFISIVALIVALAALAYAWKLQQEIEGHTRRLDRYNRALFDANDELRTLRADMARQAAELKVAIMRGSSGLRFAPETTVQEAELMHPQVRELLAAFHMGGCSDCAVEPADTLAQICAARGVALDALLANLNMLVAAEAATPAAPSARNGAGAPMLVKIPNMTLEFDDAHAD